MINWINSRVRLSGNKLAVIDVESGTELTYNQLLERANQRAAYFLSKGIGKGDRVACLGQNQAELFEILFACEKAGAVFVPLNWRLSLHELKYIIEDCSPKILLYDEKFSETVSFFNYDWLILNPIRSIPLAKESSNLTKINLTADDPWFIIYTGGTTGKPKGVVLSYQSINWNAINTIVSWGLTGDEITLTYMPLFHTGGINALSLPILMNGGTIVVANQFDPSQALINLKKYKCTIALFVPTMYHMMQQTEEFEQLDFPDMRVFLSGGAPCPLTVYERFAEKGYRFKEGYGLTEAGPNNFFITPEDAIVKKGSVGKPMMFNQVKLVDLDGKEITEANEVGELLINGNHVFKEYWNNGQATIEALHNGWLHTGDLAKRDEDGYYYIVGRKKDMIITGGENVYPLEIEQWLSEHEAINEAAVVGIPDDKWGERVTAFISLHSGASITEDDLKDYCSMRLAKYKIPKSFIILDEIPKTHVGKIDKKALKEMDTVKLAKTSKSKV